MRSAMRRLGGDPKKINPLVPVDLVIDHSVQVDKYGTSDAFATNAAAFFGLYVANTSSNTITASRVLNTAGTGVFLSTANLNTLSLSSFTGVGVSSSLK